MNGPARPGFLTLLASGGFAIAILSFTGAVWPYGDSGDAREHLAFANAVTFATFLSCLLIFSGGAVAGAARLPSSLFAKLTEILSALVFFTGLLTASLQVTEAMNAWFETSPVMPPGLITVVRILALTALAWLLASIGLVLWSAVRRSRGKTR